MRLRTGYSFRTAYGHIGDVFEKVKQIGWCAAPICDRNSTFGFRTWRDLAKGAGIKPVFGVEIGVVPRLGEDKPRVDYWQFWAMDDLDPLHSLIHTATSNPGREPSLLYCQAMGRDGIISVAGRRCLLEEMEPSAHTFVALAPSTPIGLARSAKSNGFRFLATPDNYYPNEDDREVWRLALGRNASTQSYPQHIVDDGEWREACAHLGVDLEPAIGHRDWAMDRCTATMRMATLIHPERPAPLLDMCEAGAQHLGIDLNDPVYKERLDRELALIVDKEFEDYFYIIADMVSWAKERMIVGPARGSSCGSLACYLLGITAIDPIPYGLIFERFIDVNRMDLPDIDIDFSDKHRHLVFEYAAERYGSDRVAQLGTVGKFQPRSALNTIGGSIWMPKWLSAKIGDTMPALSKGDARYGHSLQDTLPKSEIGRKALVDYPAIINAYKIENHPNTASKHAAGIVITDEPLSRFIAVDARTGATMCDKKDAEKLGLLKIDALGLTQLSIFERALELAGLPPVSETLERLPVDDPGAFAILNEGKYSGIFQFVGIAVQSLAKQVDINCLEDMIALTALARPGPLATGAAADWVRRRRGEPIPPAIHPRLGELTASSLGVVMYQETVMNICREIGQFSWADTAAIRRLMSKSEGDEKFNLFAAQFIEGAGSIGMPEETARLLWEQINTFGSWAFNRSHAVAYATVSYWCCWLKAHHPLEFAAASLDAEGDPLRQIQFLRELDAEGIGYVPVDVELSEDRWAVDRANSRLVGPLSSVKGIGPSSVNEILTARKRGESIRPALAKRLVNATTPIDSLWPIRDKVAAMHPDLCAINIISTPTPINRVIAGQDGGDYLIIGVVVRMAERDENDSQNVHKRGYEFKGPTQAVNIFIRDDTDEIFAKIDRFSFERLAPAMLERGRAGKAIYALKGPCPKDFRMIKIKQVKYLGDLEDKL